MRRFNQSEFSYYKKSESRKRIIKTKRNLISNLNNLLSNSISIEIKAVFFFLHLLLDDVQHSTISTARIIISARNQLKYIDEL
jgi:hypothetical protein